MDIQRLLQDYKITFVTEGHKHCRPGWVNMSCPFCTGNPGYHLGIHEEGKGAHCWRCGGHSSTKALSRVLGLPEPKVRALLQKYKIRTYGTRTIEPKVSIHPFKYPKPNFPLNKQGKQYLAKRGFDPAYIEQEWGLLQTGPVSFLDGISYNNRIVIPIYWNGRIVSFQARDITDKNEMKYLACPMKREETHHKNILYGKDGHWQRLHSIIVVEGVTDVWRLGPSSVATFGTAFKMEQVLRLAECGKRFFILFDNETQAQEQARSLAVRLKALRKEVFIETVKGDPGDMSQDDADALVRELVRGKEGRK